MSTVNTLKSLDGWRSHQKKGPLTLQADELWSFVAHKGNKQWVWLAIDETTREIVGVYVGRRNRSAVLEITATYLPSMCCGLHGLLGSL
jgi:insertion element IS1 protein InsB